MNSCIAFLLGLFFHKKNFFFKNSSSILAKAVNSFRNFKANVFLVFKCSGRLCISRDIIHLVDLTDLDILIYLPIWILKNSIIEDR